MRSPIAPKVSAHRASPISFSLSSIRRAAIVAAALTLAACGAAATPGAASPSASPAPTAVPTPSSTAVPTAVPTPSTTAQPSPTASIVVVTPSPSAGAPSTGCPTAIQAGIAPSDRLTDVKVDAGLGHDTITFTFGKSSGQPSGTDPTGELKPTKPPFSLGGSGQTVTIDGHTFVAITFRGMAVADAQGDPTYTGPADIHPTALAVRELRLVDDFEGVVTWLVGVDGRGCVALSRLTGPDRIVVAISQ